MPVGLLQRLWLRPPQDVRRLHARASGRTVRLMPEAMTCSCRDSKRVIVLSFQCDDCGAVTVRAHHQDGHDAPYAREKRDRRREPRS
jgi:hypothetical protein